MDDLMKDEAETGSTLSRREALRMTLATALAASLPLRLARAQEVEVSPSAAKLAALTGSDWKPIFLTDDQAHAVALIAEAIIPRTDTPGALDARCHEFIDLILSVDNGRYQERFVEGVQWMNDRSLALYGVPFIEASDEQRLEILKSISDDNKRVDREVRDGWRFFKDIKRRTIDAYYSSREGLIEELGRPEGFMFRPYMGCRHGDGPHN